MVRVTQAARREVEADEGLLSAHALEERAQPVRAQLVVGDVEHRERRVEREARAWSGLGLGIRIG